MVVVIQIKFYLQLIALKLNCQMLFKYFIYISFVVEGRLVRNNDYSVIRFNAKEKISVPVLLGFGELNESLFVIRNK